MPSLLISFIPKLISNNGLIKQQVSNLIGSNFTISVIAEKSIIKEQIFIVISAPDITLATKQSEKFPPLILCFLKLIKFGFFLLVNSKLSVKQANKFEINKITPTEKLLKI